MRIINNNLFLKSMFQSHGFCRPNCKRLCNRGYYWTNGKNDEPRNHFGLTCENI